jgi:predicted Zn-dependent protease
MPDDRDAAYNLALALLPLGGAAEAEPLLRRLRDGDSTNDDVAFNLGLSLAEQSKCSEALEVFTGIAQRSPEYPLAHLMAAREFAHFGRDDEARRFLQKELARDPAACDGWDDAEHLRERLGV